MSYVLSPGTVIGGRYRIDSLLGEGGYGITYAACHLEMGTRVAVKELYWRDHASRDAAAAPEIVLSREDTAEFDRRKQKFLEEARTLNKFRDLSGVVHVTDYFEANGTAYIVMEYIEGETLKKHLERCGRMDAKDLFRRFLPLLFSLQRIHEAHIIHRDISPDNIMVRNDESLVLIDLGAAREISEVPSTHTAIVKENYTPAEQFDKHGVLGAWTDIYALCGTLYTALTGTLPPSSIQRHFYDDLKAPSQLGVDIDPRFEAVVMKGLSMEPSRRWQSAEELAEAILDLLPESVPAKPRIRKFIPVAAAVVVCILVCSLGLYFRPKQEEDPFDGQRTMLIRLDVRSDMTVKAFDRAREELQSLLQDLTGGDYRLTEEGQRLSIILPVDCFDGKDIRSTLVEMLPEDVFGDFKLSCQIVTDWEDPANCTYPGRYQIAMSEFKKETVEYSFQASSYKNLTEAERFLSECVIKDRMDALRIPYAMGRAHDNADNITLCFDPAQAGRFLIDTVCSRYHLRLAGEGLGNYSDATLTISSTSCSAETVHYEDGSGGLLLKYNESEADKICDLTQLLLMNGQNVLYLQTEDAIPIAKLPLSAPISDGILEFSEFLLEGADSSALADYLCCLMETDSHGAVSRYESGSGVLDAKGNLLPDESADARLGITSILKANEMQYLETLRKIEADRGFEISHTDGVYYILVHHAIDGKLIEDSKEVILSLIEDFGIGSAAIDRMTLIVLIDEDADVRLRVAFTNGFDRESQKPRAMADLVITPDSNIAAYAEQIAAWWMEMPFEQYGMEGSVYRWDKGLTDYTVTPVN